MSYTKTCNGDRFILCTFSIRYGALVIESNNNLQELLKEIPHHLSEDEDRLSVCEVFQWKQDSIDWSDTIPYKLKTLFEVQYYSDPEEDSESSDYPPLNRLISRIAETP